MEGTNGMAPAASPVPPVMVPSAEAVTGDGSVLSVAISDGTPVAVGSEPVKKKRGRPRKYAPDGSLAKPLSASPPSAKRGRGRPLDQFKKGFGMASLGGMIACSSGANFTPHIITVAAGEDITMKIISFSQQGPGAVCVLSANGIVSNVSLRQSDSYGGTLTYEGRFELLSLSGSFMPTENEGTRSRSGGLSVSLASPDGRVVGGGVSGLLIAASPVQVVVGTFIPSYQMEQKTKKSKSEPVSISFQTGVNVSTIPNASHAASAYKQDAWTSPPSAVSDARNSLKDISVSVPAI